jgi:hypothetical protein
MPWFPDAIQTITRSKISAVTLRKNMVPFVILAVALSNIIIYIIDPA